VAGRAEGTGGAAAELKTRAGVGGGHGAAASRDATGERPGGGFEEERGGGQKPAQWWPGLPDVITLPSPITIEPGPASAQKQSSGRTDRRHSFKPK